MQVTGRQGAGKDERRSLFRRGFASLTVGRLGEALGDLSKHMAISEAEWDLVDRARGHFFLAMTYEQNGEPRMAAAEVEMGRNVSKELVLPWSHARLTAFLAHLWLRRGETEEARALMGEAMREAPGEGAGPWLGVILLVDAEVKATTSDLGGSERSFQWSRETFPESPWEDFYHAVASCWYGETLIGIGRTAEGRGRLEEAAALSRKLDNGRQAERAERLMT